MAFLVITCIEPVQSFLGLISLRCSMPIVAFFILICGVYSYVEAKYFFKDYKFFGLVNIDAYFIIECAIALLVCMDYFIQKLSYTRLLYLLTLALAGMTLAYNIFKTSIIDDKIEEYGIDHKLIQFMYFIRVGTQFIIEMIVCYICYSYKKYL